MRFFVSFIWLMLVAAQAVAQAPLELGRKIPLGSAGGRFDHFAIDRTEGRLFLAELGNGTVSAIDLKSGQVVHRISGLKEPQGLGYLPEAKLLVAASAGDGTLRAFDSGFAPAAKLNLGDDADNVRIDAATGEIVVGFGSGALAVIDPRTLRKKAEIKLKGHPEGFQLDPSRRRAFVNVPDAHEIAVVELDKGVQVAAWDKLPARANFPMALMGEKLAVGFRNPARLAVFDTHAGVAEAVLPLCGDTDDIFFDARRGRLYVSCGEGKIDVFDAGGAAPKLLAEIATSSGARTAFFDADSDRYYLAVRAGLTTPAEIWVYHPG